MLRYTIVTFLFLIALFGALFSLFPSDTSLAGVQDSTSALSLTGVMGSFDWRWLVPLFAIPVVLVVMPNHSTKQTHFYTGGGLVGLKGGESKRTQDEVVEGKIVTDDTIIYL